MSTERMDDNQGTARMDGGTDRMDAGTARMDGNKGPVATSAGAVVFVSGQTIVLNGRDCVIDSVISGSSGEAIVYKVIIDGKPYALKHYKPNTPLSDTANKVIAKIKDNPRDRVIKIYDFGKYNEQDFEIMEYAEGGTLDQYIKNNGAIREMTKIKNIVKMITEGLEQLHKEYKVIYQDLKPENIYFKDANKTSLVLADFGISSIMEGYDEEVEVTASITDLYAAPELAHKGNRNEVMATPAVDYYALGITMFELWLGEKPFKGVKATQRDYLIAEEKVDFPIDMPDDYAAIIRGLIRPQRKDRWGNEHVRKWLKGETLAVESRASQKASTAYDPLKFSNTESAVNPKELAALLDKYPDIGKTCLYDGIIKSWLQKAGDLMLYNEIQNITSHYALEKDSGLYTAILALDPERPFKSRSGKICKTTEDIADAIMAESAYYMEDLKKPNANLYLYLAATEGSQGKEAADSFCNYFKEYSPKRALALVCLKLQSDGGITIGSKHYQSPDELKHERDSAQIDLIKKAVNEKDSMLLVWLSDIYGDNLKSTDIFINLSTPEQFFLLGLLPFLSFKEFISNSQNALRDLIDTCPGRSDLFEIYAAQGLPLTGQNCGGYKRTSVDYAAYNFNDLRIKHGTDTVSNMIRLLCKLGADVNEYSSDGMCPLINAYNAKNNDLVELLLELGADENQYCAYKEKIEEQKRLEQERRAEQERQEAKRKRKEDAKEKRKKIIRILTPIVIIFIIVYRLTGSFFKFQQNDQGTITVTGYSGRKDVVIPATHKGVSVTEIGNKAFFQKKITSVIIPDSITSIGEEAFAGCTSLTAINVDADNTEFSSQDGVLYDKTKTTLLLYPAGKTGEFTIPDSVTSIGGSAFSNCTRLRTVVIPARVKVISDGAFAGCTGLTDVTIGNGVTSIERFAFAKCTGLYSIIIPNKVTTIGEASFGECTNLTSITFEGKIASDGFDADAYRGDLRDEYLAGGRGTYFTKAPVNDNSKWTKLDGTWMGGDGVYFYKLVFDGTNITWYVLRDSTYVVEFRGTFTRQRAPDLKDYVGQLDITKTYMRPATKQKSLESWYMDIKPNGEIVFSDHSSFNKNLASWVDTYRKAGISSNEPGSSENSVPAVSVTTPAAPKAAALVFPEEMRGTWRRQKDGFTIIITETTFKRDNERERTLVEKKGNQYGVSDGYERMYWVIVLNGPNLEITDTLGYNNTVTYVKVEEKVALIFPEEMRGTWRHHTDTTYTLTITETTSESNRYRECNLVDIWGGKYVISGGGMKTSFKAVLEGTNLKISESGMWEAIRNGTYDKQ